VAVAVAAVKKSPAVHRTLVANRRAVLQLVVETTPLAVHRMGAANQPAVLQLVAASLPAVLQLVVATVVAKAAADARRDTSSFQS